MTRSRPAYNAAAALTILALILAGCPAMLRAQTPPADSKIVDVVVEGNQRVDANRILAQMKLREGSVYSAQEANEDFKRIYALREFDNVELRPEPAEGGLRLTVRVTESPLLAGIEFTGAKHISRKDLLQIIGLTEGAPMDRHRQVSAAQVIADEYKRKGYYFAEVRLDAELLAKSSVARFTVSEGPKVSVAKVVFQGNQSISNARLQKEIETRKGFWFFTSGTFSEQVLEGDVGRLKAYYLGQGFLDVKVARAFEFDTRNEKVTVRFIIDEGPRYRVASVSIRGVGVLDSADMARKLKLKAGEFYTTDALQTDTQTIYDSYGRIGYVHARADPKVEFTAEAGRVDVIYQVTEGPKITIGEISVDGNRITQDKVILRALGFEPLDVADAREITRARQRLLQSRLFNKADIALLPTDNANVENVAVHVEEAKTSSFIIGAGISSESGLIGNIMLIQRNFDAARWPRGWNDPGAWRGAGQTLRLTFEPGTEYQQYSIGFTEPYLFDRPIRLDASGSYFKRERDGYDESRLGGQFSLGKDLARDLYGSLGFRLENIDIDNVSAGSPPDVFKVAGSSYLSSVTVRLVRDKTDSVFIPTTGSRLSAAVEQAGVLGGDYTFTKLVLDGKRYWTVTEDVLGRRSVFCLKGRLGFAPGDPPIFERFYAGGQSTIRGFAFRGAGPFQGNDPVGGDFLMLLSGEYQFPLWGENLRGVVFMDTGTVEENIALSDYRVSVGFGMRFDVNMWGTPVPFALDFGFPLSKGGDDETEFFSFSIAWTF